MSVVVHIPASLRGESKGRRQLTVVATTVDEALAQLRENHPPLYRSVCDETGAVRRHVNLFVNDTMVAKSQTLGTPLADGDELSIMPAVSGG